MNIKDEMPNIRNKSFDREPNLMNLAGQRMNIDPLGKAIAWLLGLLLEPTIKNHKGGLEFTLLSFHFNLFMLIYTEAGNDIISSCSCLWNPLQFV